MNNSMKTGIDNLLMTTLVVTSLVMVIAGPALSGQDTQAVISLANHHVQAVSTPAAVEPILQPEAAIIVTAPRLRAAA